MRPKIPDDDAVYHYQNSHQNHHQQQLQQQQHQLYLQQLMQDQEDNAFYEDVPEAPPVKRRALVPVQPPKVRRVVEVPMRPFGSAIGDSAAPVRPTLKSVIFERFKSLCSSWIEGGKRGQGKTEAVLASRGFQPIGVNTLRHLGSACVEQDRLKSQFIGEVARCMGRHLQAVTEDLSWAVGGSEEKVVTLSAASTELQSIVHRYQAAAAEMVSKSQVDLVGYVAMDALMGAGSEKCDLKVIFRHGELWESARSFLSTVELIVRTCAQSQ
jgi:hypothetical protein